MKSMFGSVHLLNVVFCILNSVYEPNKIFSFSEALNFGRCKCCYNVCIHIQSHIQSTPRSTIVTKVSTTAMDVNDASILLTAMLYIVSLPCNCHVSCVKINVFLRFVVSGSCSVNMKHDKCCAIE